MTRLGYQIPNFTYPGKDPAAIFPTVVAQAKAAEAVKVEKKAPKKDVKGAVDDLEGIL